MLLEVGKSLIVMSVIVTKIRGLKSILHSKLFQTVFYCIISNSLRVFFIVFSMDIAKTRAKS